MVHVKKIDRRIWENGVANILIRSKKSNLSLNYNLKAHLKSPIKIQKRK